MNYSKFIGAGVGFVIGTIIVAILCTFMRNGDKKIKYDERQELVRGKGYKYAFFSTIIFFAAKIVAEIAFDFPLDDYINNATQIFIGIIFGVLVYVCYAIWNDAYIALNERFNRVIISFSLIIVLNLVPVVSAFVNSKSFPNYSLNLICCIALLIIIICMIVKRVFFKEEVE